MTDLRAAPAGRERPLFASLPFVRDGENGRSWWSVEPSGDYVADCRTGELHGLAFLDALACGGLGPLRLSQILAGMLAAQDRNGIVVGFASALQDALSATVDPAFTAQLRSFCADRHERIVRHIEADAGQAHSAVPEV